MNYTPSARASRRCPRACDRGVLADRRAMPKHFIMPRSKLDGRWRGIAVRGGDAAIFNLGAYWDMVDARLEQWESMEFIQRLWERDPTLWFPEPMPEVVDRLGWLSLGETMRSQLDDYVDMARQIREEGMTDVVLLGMGGSSLAPAVFQGIFGNAPGYPALTVLDDVHPGAVRGVRRLMDPHTTLFIVSSKSGATLETMSLFRYFWEEMLSAGDNRGHHFIAITDQGTPLARLASERGFRRLFVATPDVGGRYSALTAFGLVPAALIGVDVKGLLDRSFMRVNDMFTKTPGEVDGLVLGSALGELAISERDKVTFISSPSVRSFPSWIEQLIAESTGKDGRGMVPITGEPPLEPSSYLPDRFFIGLSVRGEGDEVEERMERLEDAGHPTVQMMLEDKLDLGGAIFDLELAVASAATVLGIHPFNQPDVQMTKDMVKKMVVDGRSEEGTPGDVEAASINDPDELRNALREWLSQARRGDYISIQAYLGPDDEVSDGLQQLRSEILYDLNLATALDHGPQFLHSTGQLHKGGPNTGLFLQLIEQTGNDLEVPGTRYTFGELVHASSIGDYRVLTERGRRILRVDLGRDAAGAITRLVAEIRLLTPPAMRAMAR